MSFASLGLSDLIVRAVTEHGYTEPTPIQKSAIPAVLGGRDLLAGAQTGTGKTAGFVLPILQRLTDQVAAGDAKARRRVSVLILTPTRELAAQIEESVRVYGKYTPVQSTVIFGGVGMQPQVDRLARSLDILVATPGRLLDHVQQRTLDLSTVKTLVLDEADRMLDMGFIRDVKRILALLPKQRQNLLFSATFADEIKVARRLPAARADGNRGGTPQCDRRARGAAHLRRAQGSQAPPARAPDQGTRLAPGAGVHAHQARRQPPGRAADQGRHNSARNPRQQEPDGTHARVGRVQGRLHPGAGGDRHRRARHRHQGTAARRELRPAQRARGLRAPHRAHRAREHVGRGDLADRRGRHAAARRHRAPDQAQAAARDAVARGHGSARGGREERGPRHRHPPPAAAARRSSGWRSLGSRSPGGGRPGGGRPGGGRPDSRPSATSAPRGEANGNRMDAPPQRPAGSVHQPRGSGQPDGRMGRSDNRQGRDNNRPAGVGMGRPGAGFGRGSR